MISSLALSFRRGGRATAFALALAVGATSLTPLVPPLGQSARAAVISIHVRERLSRYGEWQQSTRYGEVWVPSVETGWRPYTVGRWVWTDDGWYWDSSEPFGQIVFHYGRWAYDPDLGWVWIVGDEWAPAWVVWRESDDDIGWMPAPPRDDVPVQDAWWAFVPIAAIGAANLVQVVRPPAENQTLIQNTTIINQRVVVNEYNNIGSTRLGKETIPINAGPPMSRLPANVVAKVRAAGIVPPPRGGNFAAARLDPSKGREVKRAAVKLRPNAQTQAGQNNAPTPKPKLPPATTGNGATPAPQRTSPQQKAAVNKAPVPAKPARQKGPEAGDAAFGCNPRTAYLATEGKGGSRREAKAAAGGSASRQARASQTAAGRRDAAGRAAGTATKKDAAGRDQACGPRRAAGSAATEMQRARPALQAEGLTVSVRGRSDRAPDARSATTGQEERAGRVRALFRSPWCEDEADCSMRRAARNNGLPT